MKLASILDLSAAAPLWADVQAARGQPLSIDASAVERLGGLCLQALIAAQKQWRDDGLDFSIANASDAFRDGVRLMAAHDLVHGEPSQ